MRFYKVTGIEVFVRADNREDAIETALAGMDPAIGSSITAWRMNSTRRVGIFDYAQCDEPPKVEEVNAEDYPVVVG